MEEQNNKNNSFSTMIAEIRRTKVFLSVVLLVLAAVVAIFIYTGGKFDLRSSVGAVSLATGQDVRVGVGVVVRETPGSAGLRKGIQAPGSSGKIVEGPVTADGGVWWKVDFESDPDGWVLGSQLIPKPSVNYLKLTGIPLEKDNWVLDTERRSLYVLNKGHYSDGAARLIKVNADTATVVKDVKLALPPASPSSTTTSCCTAHIALDDNGFLYVNNSASNYSPIYRIDGNSLEFVMSTNAVPGIAVSSFMYTTSLLGQSNRIINIGVYVLGSQVTGVSDNMLVLGQFASFPSAAYRPFAGTEDVNGNNWLAGASTLNWNTVSLYKLSGMSHVETISIDGSAYGGFNGVRHMVYVPEENALIIQVGTKNNGDLIKWDIDTRSITGDPVFRAGAYSIGTLRRGAEGGYLYISPASPDAKVIDVVGWREVSSFNLATLASGSGMSTVWSTIYDSFDHSIWAVSTAGLYKVYLPKVPLPAHIDNTPPTIAVTSPAGSATVSGLVNLSANAQDNVGISRVQFLIDGVNFGSEDATSPYELAWDTTTALGGSHTITAITYDPTGNGTRSAPVAVIVNNTPVDTVAPTVSEMILSKDKTALSGVVSLSVEASDAVEVVGVQFKLDGVNLGSEITTPSISMGTTDNLSFLNKLVSVAHAAGSVYRMDWNTATASNGSHALTAVVRDAAGNTTTSAPVTVTVNNDTIPPTVKMSTNAGTQNYLPGSRSLSATVTDNVAVASVIFTISKPDGTVLTTLPASRTRLSIYTSAVWDPLKLNGLGIYNVSAIATDTAGNKTTSNTITLTIVDNTGPATSINTPLPFSSIAGKTTVPISTNSVDNVRTTKVEIYIDNVLKNTCNATTATTTLTCSYNWSMTGVTNGKHTIRAKAYDNNTPTVNTASTTYSVTR